MCFEGEISPLSGRDAGDARRLEALPHSNPVQNSCFYCFSIASRKV